MQDIPSLKGEADPRRSTFQLFCFKAFASRRFSLSLACTLRLAFAAPPAALSNGAHAPVIPTSRFSFCSRLSELTYSCVFLFACQQDTLHSLIPNII
jgi:hypothetical protein